MTVSAKQGTFVNVNRQQGSAVYYVNDSSSITYSVSHNDRVTYGVESKGFVLTSDEPVSVYIGTEYQQSYRIPDEIIIRPVTSDDTEYIISSYPGTGSSGGSPGSYFIITSQYDDTSVQMFSFENDIWVQKYSGVLNKFEVMTEDSYITNDGVSDYTGWRVLASQPISVIAGHGYATFGSRWQHTCDSMPSIAAMGVNYITFPVLFGLGTEGYVVRIAGSTTEDITVSIPELGIEDVIPRGSYLEVKSLISSSLIRVTRVY